MDQFFHCRKSTIPGTSYREVYSKALPIFQVIKRKSKRLPYIKSSYFSNQKIFIYLFWDHLYQKNIRDRARRLKFIDCAFELLKDTNIAPILYKNPNKKSEFLYRFFGVSSDGKEFVVQVKKTNKDKKYLMSFFPK